MPWQMPGRYEVRTRLTRPWATGADRPDRLLAVLADEVVRRFSLSDAVAAALRIRLAQSHDAVLARAQTAGEQYRAAKEKLGHRWRVFARWALGVLCMVLGVLPGPVLLVWRLADELALPRWAHVVGVVVVPLVFVVIAVIGEEVLISDPVELAGVVPLVLMGLAGFTWAGVDVVGGVGGGALGLVAELALLLLAGFGFLFLYTENRWHDLRWLAQKEFDLWAESVYGHGVLWALAEVSNRDAPGTWLPVHSRRLVDTVVDVDTSAAAELRRLAALSRGSFALAGPRGAGKSTLLQQWCSQDARDLSVVVSAPVGYKPDEFLVHLFGRVCDAVEQRGSARLRYRAQVERDALRYVLSRTSEHEGAFDAPLFPGTKLGVKRKVSVKRDDVPLNHPQRVDRFRAFLGEVGDEVGRGGGTVLIGIDELDRVSDGDQAQQFLNELKAVFNVPNCYFLVSVSEDALADFELAAMGMRTVFDSAFDTVIRVDYLRFEQAKTLLRQCVVDVPDQFTALAYVLSGGLARELMRIADVMTGLPADGAHGRGLTGVAEHLVARQLGRTARAAMDRLSRLEDRAAGARLIPVLDDEFPLGDLRAYAARVEGTAVGPAAQATRLDVVVMIEYLATLLDVFDDRLDEDRMRTGLTRGPGDFETLAKVRRYLGANPFGARELLAACDKAWRTPG